MITTDRSADEPQRELVAPTLLVAVAVAGTALPVQSDRAADAVQAITGLDAVPWELQAAVSALACAAAVVVAFRSPYRLWPLFAVTALVVVLRGSAAVLVVASYCAGLRLRRLPQVTAYAAAAAAVAFAPHLLALDAVPLDGFLGTLGLFVAAPLAFGQWIGARRDVLAGLRTRAAQAERERELRAAQARAQERARIAGDMHDVVAHRVSLMVLYAGALEVQGDARTGELAGLIRTTGREALTQLREVLGVLTDPGAGQPPAPQPTLRELDELVQRSRAAGLDLRRVDEGEPRELPLVVQHAAYRVVQEALTNVHKHAGPVRTEIRLRYQADALEVIVGNAPPARPVTPLPGSGTGLLGLRERVELLGGRFSAEPGGDGGFEVAARLPVHPAEEDTA